MKRRILAAVTVAVLLLIAVPAGADSEAEPAAGAGTATTVLTLADVALEGLPLDGLDLGTLTSYASTDPDPARNVLGDGERFAQALLDLPVVGEVGVRSDDTSTRDGQTIDLPEGLGTLTVGALEAATTATSAVATVEALAGSVALPALGGLTAALPETGAFTIVDADQATAGNGAVLEGLGLGLTDLLPIEVLEQLPLSVLLDLVDGLPLDLDLGPVLDALRGQLQALRGELDELVDLGGTLDTLLDGAGYDTIDALEAALAQALTELDAVVVFIDAEETVEELLGDLDDVVDGILAGASGIVLQPILESVGLEGLCDNPIARDLIEPLAPGLCDALTDALDDLADAQALLESVGLPDLSLSDALELRDTLTALVASLEAVLDAVFELVDDLLGVLDGIFDLLETITLTDLLDLVEGILDGLAGLELLDIGRVTVGVESIATADGSSATAVCSVAGTTVLGETVDTCAALTDALAGLQETLLALLDPITNVTGGAISIGGLAVSETPDDAEDDEYFTAAAAVDALVVHLDSLEVEAVADTLVADLEQLIEDALEELLGLIGDLGDVHTFAAVDAAQLGDLEQLLGLLRGELEGLLEGLLGLGLPTELVAGLATPGVSLEALGIGSEANYTTTGDVTPEPPAVATPPPAPTPSTALPRTGGGLALALLLLLAGGGLAHATRRTGRAT